MLYPAMTCLAFGGYFIIFQLCFRYTTNALPCYDIHAWLLMDISLLFSYFVSDTPLMLYPAMTCLAFGGYFIMMTNIQLANLIPSKRSTVIALYCGSYDSSAFILVLVKVRKTARKGKWKNGCFQMSSCTKCTAQYLAQLTCEIRLLKSNHH